MIMSQSLIIIFFRIWTSKRLHLSTSLYVLREITIALIKSCYEIHRVLKYFAGKRDQKMTLKRKIRAKKESSNSVHNHCKSLTSFKEVTHFLVFHSFFRVYHEENIGACDWYLKIKLGGFIFSVDFSVTNNSRVSSVHIL